MPMYTMIRNTNEIKYNMRCDPAYARHCGIETCYCIIRVIVG